MPALAPPGQIGRVLLHLRLDGRPIKTDYTSQVSREFRVCRVPASPRRFCRSLLHKSTACGRSKGESKQPFSGRLETGNLVSQFLRRLEASPGNAPQNGANTVSVGRSQVASSSREPQQTWAVRSCQCRKDRCPLRSHVRESSSRSPRYTDHLRVPSESGWPP